MSWAGGSWNPGWNPGWQGPSTGTDSSATTVGNDYGLLQRRSSPDVTKAPAESVRVSFAWAARLQGEAIESVDYAFPDGLTEGDEAGDGTLRSVIVSGGDADRMYRVVSTVVTDGGRTLQWVKRVLVLEG